VQNTIKKTYISCEFCFEIFLGNTYKFCYKEKFANKQLLSIFLQNILYKIFFTTNFVENTYEFYNFIENNYPRRNYLPIKIHRKSNMKKFFCKFF